MSFTPSPRKFLVIDDNADSRTLLTRTLLRKFPNSVTIECETGDAALALAAGEKLHAIVAHRTFDHDGETLVQLLRGVATEVPIVMVSGYDRRVRARECGADAFMNYDAWLTIGNVVADVLTARARDAKGKPVTAVRAKSSAEPDPV